MKINQYAYEDLKNNLDKEDSKENRLNLLKWFELYGVEYWNGESYEIENGERLYPIYDKNDEIIDAERR